MTPVREALEAKIERLRKSHFAGMEIMRNFALEIIEALSAAPGEPCAYVPVHPRHGELWSETYPAADGDVTERRSSHYKRKPLFTTPQPAAGRDVLRSNLREAWSGLAMIRETVETLGPVGVMPASENLNGPTFMHEAEAIVQGIQLMALRREAPAPAEGVTVELEPWRDELSEIAARLGAAIVQSCAKDDQIIMDHVKAAHEIAKIVRRKA